MFFEEADAPHHAIERGLSAFVDAISVVQFSGTVDGNSNEKVLLPEESAPLVVQQDAIGLKGIFNSFSIRIFGLQRDDVAKIIDSQQRRLTALPGKMDRIRILL